MKAEVQKVEINGRQTVVRKPLTTKGASEMETAIDRINVSEKPKGDKILTDAQAKAKVERKTNGKTETPKPVPTPPETLKQPTKAPKCPVKALKSDKAPTTPKAKKAPKKELTAKEKAERNEKFKAYVSKPGATWKAGSNSAAIYGCLKPNTGTLPEEIVKTPQGQKPFHKY